MDFFVFSDRFDSTVPRLSVGSENFELWKAAVRGQPSGVLRGEQYMGGRQWKDFLWTGLVSTPIMSQRVHDLLEKHEIRGWISYRVRVFDFGGAEIPGYMGLGITGRCEGRIEFDKRESALVYRPSAKGKPMPHFHGLGFDRDRWDGSDIFMDQEGTGWILVTGRVAKLFKKCKVSNCVFQPVESIELLALETEILNGQ